MDDILKHTTVKEFHKGKDRLTIILDQLKDLTKYYKSQESEVVINVVKRLTGSNEAYIKEKASKLLSENNSCSDLTNATTNVELLIENGKALIKNMNDTIEGILNYLIHCSEKPYYKQYTCYLKQVKNILDQVTFYNEKMSSIIHDAETVVSEMIGDLYDCLFHKTQILKSQVKNIKQNKL